MLLEHDDILNIQSQAVAAALHTKREQLLFGVNIQYVASLPIDHNPGDQLLADLATMNNDGAIAGGVPLVRWLRNAAYATSMRPDKQKFFRELADKAEDSATAAVGQPSPVHQTPERILFVSDLLPIGFLTGAVRTGRSVVKLKVPRFEGEQQRMHPASGNPVVYYGTGWLIGPKHVITNHHIINARREGEAPANPEEFGLQASRTEVEFDYDDQIAAVEKFTVTALSIADAPLDYAVLELDRAPERQPLPIWARAIDFIEGSRLPVNIIQHPGGQPKQIAIRNNLTAALKGGDLAYFTDTEAGSSGSPVCNDRWQVLALHKASTRSMGRYQYQGKDTIWVNVGTTIERIVGDVQSKDNGLWTRIGALTV